MFSLIFISLEGGKNIPVDLVRVGFGWGNTTIPLNNFLPKAMDTALEPINERRYDKLDKTSTAHLDLYLYPVTAY